MTDQLINPTFSLANHADDFDRHIEGSIGIGGTIRGMPGADTDRMLAELRAALTPYLRDGPVMEKHTAVCIICRRIRDS